MCVRAQAGGPQVKLNQDAPPITGYPAVGWINYSKYGLVRPAASLFPRYTPAAGCLITDRDSPRHFPSFCIFALCPLPLCPLLLFPASSAIMTTARTTRKRQASAAGAQAQSEAKRHKGNESESLKSALSEHTCAVFGAERCRKEQTTTYTKCCQAVVCKECYEQAVQVLAAIPL